MISFVYGYPVTGFSGTEESSSARVFRFKAPAPAGGRPPNIEGLSRWESALTRSLNALHPHARMRFADPFLLRAPAGGRRGRFLRAQGLRAPAGLVLALDPVLPGGDGCLACPEAAACAGDSMSYATMSRVVREARFLGVRMFFCLARDPLSYRPELVDLALRHPDCAFLLLSPEAVTEEGFLRDLAEAGNAAVVLGVVGFELETDVLHGPGAYAAFERAMKAARAAGLPFGFAACCYNGNAPAVFSRGFLEGMLEDGALFGMYYTCPERRSGRDRQPTAVQLRDTAVRIRSARERYPISLIDLRQDVTFRCAEAREGMPLHWVDSSIRHLTLLESLELAALGSRCGCDDAAHRRSCVLRRRPGMAQDRPEPGAGAPSGRRFLQLRRCLESRAVPRGCPVDFHAGELPGLDPEHPAGSREMRVPRHVEVSAFQAVGRQARRLHIR